MKDNFFIKIETYHKPGKGDEENVHELIPEQLKHREIIHIGNVKQWNSEISR